MENDAKEPLLPDIDEILMQNENLEPDLENDLCSVTTVDDLEAQPLDVISISSSDTASTVSTTRRSVLTGTPVKLQRRVPSYLLKFGLLKHVTAQLGNLKEKVDWGQLSCVGIGNWLAIGTTRGLVFLFDFHQEFVECLGNLSQCQLYGAVSALSFNRTCDRILVGFAKGHIDMWDISKLSKNQGTKDSPSKQNPLQSQRCHILRSMDDVAALNYAVLFLRFTDDPTLALCADSGGSVFQMQFKRGISGRTCDFSCLFSGARGEMCCIEPLLLPRTVTEHPVAEYRLVAMASFSQVHVISLSSKSQVVYKHPLKGDPSVFPLLAWQFVPLETTKKTTWRVDPILAFARNSTLHLVRVQLSPVPPHSLQFRLIQTIQLDYSLINMKWLGNFTLCLIDKLEILHVLDVPSESELDRYDMGRVKLSYNSSLFKALATGGNVSPALAYAGERACQHSVVVYEGQLIFLGLNFLHLYMLRDWEERLESLLEHGYLEAAIRVCIEYHQGTAKTYPGLEAVGGYVQRKQLIESKVPQLVHKCLTAAVSSPPSTTLGAASSCSPLLSRSISAVCQSNGESLVPAGLLLTLCRLCSCIDNQEEVLGIIFDILNAQNERSRPSDGLSSTSLSYFLDILGDFVSGKKQTFTSSPKLEERQPHELGLTDDKHSLIANIRHIPPSLMQALITQLYQRGQLNKLQECITRVDVTCLDLDMVSKLCWNNGLYHAIIHIYTTAMLDYRTPLEKMTQKLQQHLDNVGAALTEEQFIQLGQQLLVFTQASLRGESYSVEPVPSDLSASIQDTAFHHLITKNSENLITYLLFDTNEFLNMVTLVIEEPFFNMPVIPESPQTRKELLMERIISLMLVSKESRRFTSYQIGRLCVFLARKVDQENDRNLLDIVFSHLELMFEHVCSVRCEEYAMTQTDNQHGRPQYSRHVNQELQQALVDLLHFVLVQTQSLSPSSTAGVIVYKSLMGGVRSKVDINRLLLLVSTARLHQVKEYILQQRQDYGPIVQCYLDDEDRQHLVFNYVIWTYENSQLSSIHREAVHDSCMKDLPRLIHVSAEKTVLLCVRTFDEPILSLIRLLEHHPNRTSPNDSSLVFKFLRAAYQLSRDTLTEGDVRDEAANKALGDSFLGEKFIQLCCQHAPGEVLTFLKNHKVYNVDRALQIVRANNMQREMAYLLERSNRIEDAARVYLQLYNTAWRHLEERVKRLSRPPLVLQDDADNISEDPAMSNPNQGTEAIEAELEEVEASCQNYMRLCLRYVNDWPQQRQESIWFPLLDTMLEAQRSQLDHTLSTVIKRLFRILLSSMSHHIALATILAKILKDPAYAGEKFSNLQTLILDMLETFHYESTLLQTCKRLSRYDLSFYYTQYLRQAQHGFGPRRYRCYICRMSIRKFELMQSRSEDQEETETDSSPTQPEAVGVIIFRCGHGYHAPCLQKSRCYTFDYSISQRCGGDRGSPKIWLCPVCQDPSPSLQDAFTDMEVITRARGSTLSRPSVTLSGEEDVAEEADDLETALKQHEAMMVKNPNVFTVFLRASRSWEMRPHTLREGPNVTPSSTRYDKFLEENQAPNKIAILRELSAIVAKERPAARSSKAMPSASSTVRSRFHTLMNASRVLNPVPEIPF